MPLPGLSLSAPSAANSKSGEIGYSGSQETQAGGSMGNRGLQLNFAAEGSRLSAEQDINGPGAPSAWAPWILVVGVVALVVVIVWRTYGHR